MLSEDELYYRVALTMVSGVGPVSARRLIEQFGSASAVFRDRIVPVDTFHDFAAVERTLAFARKHHIRILCPGDPEYPIRLKDCPDAPSVLYYKGSADLNDRHTLSIVGTRTPSPYGQQAVRSLLRGLSVYDVLIVSGLAYGIDSMAHRHALENSIPTVAILGHGLDRIYPVGNRLLARDILENGGLLAEFRQGTSLENFNFPMRNRIIAGMSEATIVIESATRGGSLITAELAVGYHRQVFAVPGRIGDAKSKGCNELITQLKASCLTDASEVAEAFHWQVRSAPPSTPPHSPANAAETLVLDLLRNRDFVHLDELRLRIPLASSALAAVLLGLELRRVIEVLPGSRYRLVS